MSEVDFFGIFKTQLEGEVKSASELILQLEKSPNELKLLQALMREFHTMKGAARAIEFDQIKDIAHHIEHIYHGLIDNKLSAKACLTDLSLFALDLISETMRCKIEGVEFPDLQPFKQAVDDYLADKEPVLPSRQSHPVSVAVFSNEGDNTEVKEIYSAPEQQETPVVQPTVKSPTSSKPEQSDVLAEKLFNLTGEITVVSTAFENQRLGFRKVESDLKDLIEHLQQHQTVDLSQIKLQLQSCLGDQQKAIEQLDATDLRLRFLSEELDEQVSLTRLVPLETVFSSYPRMVRDLCKELDKRCEVIISGQDLRIDHGVLDAVRLPLLHLIRNAVDHGLKPDHDGVIEITAVLKAGQVDISIIDNGFGIDMEAVKQKVISKQNTTLDLWQKMSTVEQQQFLFLPGFTTCDTVSETSGRGIGLDVVKSEVEKVGGLVHVHSQPGAGTQFTLSLPLSLSLTRCLVVKGGLDAFFGVQLYAFPVVDLDSIMRIQRQNIRVLEGREHVRLGQQTIPLYSLANTMGHNPISNNLEQKHCLLIGSGEQKIALLVEEVVEEQSLVNRRFDERLGKIANIDGISMLSDGNMALIIDMRDLLLALLDQYQPAMENIAAQYAVADDGQAAQHILVVEDSVTVREVERHFLEAAGFMVTTAVNGADGLNKVNSAVYDLIISDIDMPRMNGIEMIEKIRLGKKQSDIPVIVVSYKDRPEDRAKALTAGANLYVVKSDFDSNVMLERIAELLQGQIVEAQEQ